MIEPARIYELSLKRDALEVKPETADYGQTPVVGGCSGTSDPVDAGPNESELEAGACRFGHVPVAARIAIQPITKFTRPVQMHTIVEAYQAEELLSRDIPDDESQCPTTVPIRGASACEALTGFLRIIIGYPG